MMIACCGGDTSGRVPGAFSAQFLSLGLWKAPDWEQFSGCALQIDKLELGVTLSSSILNEMTKCFPSRGQQSSCFLLAKVEYNLCSRC